MRSRYTVLPGLLLGFPAFLAAQSPTTFLVRLGADTTSLEQFSTERGTVTIDAVTRAPRLMRRHATYVLAGDGSMVRAEVLAAPVGAAGGGPPALHTVATFDHDSAHIEIRADTNVRRMTNAVPHGSAIPVASLWVMYDLLSTRLTESKRDSLHLPMAYLGAPDISWLAVRRMGKDSIDIETEFDRYHARVDARGHLVALRPIRGTQQYSVDRVEGMDLDRFANRYAAEGAAGGLGVFSPRDTARADGAGARLWIDYGRPSKRGRVIFGGVVPYGEIWRTGANAATQFSTDKAIAFGATVVPAGKYTLWTLPAKDGWTLIINGETGQWGTEHKAARDLYRIPMSVSSNSSPVEKFFIHIADENGKGQMHFVWDTTVLAVDYAVQQ